MSDNVTVNVNSLFTSILSPKTVLRTDKLPVEGDSDSTGIIVLVNLTYAVSSELILPIAFSEDTE